VGGGAERRGGVVAGGGRFGGKAGFIKPHLMLFSIYLNRKFYLLLEKTLLKDERLAIIVGVWLWWFRRRTVQIGNQLRSQGSWEFVSSNITVGICSKNKYSCQGCIHQDPLVR
jgi:hypothetical protein